jgi:hypothetical protein
MTTNLSNMKITLIFLFLAFSISAHAGWLGSDTVKMDFDKCVHWHEHPAYPLEIPDKKETKGDRFKLKCVDAGKKAELGGKIYKCSKDPYDGSPVTNSNGTWQEGYRSPSLILSVIGEYSKRYWRVDCDLTEKTCTSWDVYENESPGNIGGIQWPAWNSHTECTGKYTEK